MLCFRMFEPLHLATSDKIYPSKEGFYVVIISSIVNELRKYTMLIISFWALYIYLYISYFRYKKSQFYTFLKHFHSYIYY